MIPSPTDTAAAFDAVESHYSVVASSVQIAKANPTRVYLGIFVAAGSGVQFSTKSGVTSTTGITVLSGQKLEFFYGQHAILSTVDWYAIGQTASAPVTVLEVLLPRPDSVSEPDIEDTQNVPR